MKHSKAILASALILLICTVLPMLTSCNSFSDTEYAVVREGIISAEGFIYDKYENSTVRITGIEHMPLLLKIPAEIDGMPVVELAEAAFADDTTILYLELPKAASIKLGRRACSGCTSLVSVELAGSVGAIPIGAFEDCDNLSMISGMSAVTEIGDQAFAGCSSLACIDLPSGLTTLGAEAFRGCSSLASVTVSGPLSTVGESVFWGCESLARAEISGGAAISRYMFLSCSALTEVVIGDTVETIGEEAFRGCGSLYSISLGKSIKTIEEYAFHACDSLADISFAGSRAAIDIADGNEALEASDKGV